MATWPPPLLFPVPLHHMYEERCAPRPACPSSVPLSPGNGHPLTQECVCQQGGVPRKERSWEETRTGPGRGFSSPLGVSLGPSGPQTLEGDLRLRQARGEPSRVGDGKLQLAGQIQPASCVCTYSLGEKHASYIVKHKMTNVKKTASLLAGTVA